MNLAFIDLDGTLVNSFLTHQLSIIQAIKSVKEISEEEEKMLRKKVGELFGVPARKIFLIIKKELNIDESVDKLLKIKSEIFKENLENVKLFECAREFLVKMKKSFSLALASNSPESDVKNILRKFRLEKFFDLIIWSNNKTKEEKIMNALKILSSCYKNIVFIDDNAETLEKFRDYGLVIGVLTGKSKSVDFEIKKIKFFNNLCEAINFLKTSRLLE